MSVNGKDLDVVKAQSDNVEIAIKHEKGKIVLAFFRPVDRITLDPPNAVLIAKEFLDLAQVCGHEVVLQVPKRKITKEQRDRLINRATLVFKNLSEKGRAPGYIAREVVDSILSAID